MVKRRFWLDRIQEAWKGRSVLWLSGVRRAGKTSLCHSLKAEYFDCELPRTRQLMEEDPEAFLSSLKGKKIALDEIHRLKNPSELLKIAADHYPEVKMIATGSSTLGASSKFRDTLTDRKADLWLTPMILADLNDFGNSDMNNRFFRGGLPPFFMADATPEREFQEWMDAYWAKDIQELFRLERRDAFQKFFELLMAQSGGIFEATGFGRACEASRPTISNYLKALESTYVVHVLRPFNSRKATEIVAAPKVYGFDTGFVCYYRGWTSLRQDDMGLLWEHFVLNEMQARRQSRQIHYWRDKAGHEVDFILPRRGTSPIAIECKWKSKEFDPSALAIFRKQYPGGRNYAVVQDADRPFRRNYDHLEVEFTSLEKLFGKKGTAAIL